MDARKGEEGKEEEEEGKEEEREREQLQPSQNLETSRANLLRTVSC